MAAYARPAETIKRGVKPEAIEGSQAV